MLDKIVNGIKEKLNKTFGDNYKIFTESLEPELKEPCFLIQLVGSANKQSLGDRCFRENLFCIQYLPVTGEPNAECWHMQDELFLSLEEIMLDGDPQRGTKMHSELVEGILYFFINYDLILSNLVSVSLTTLLFVLRKGISNHKSIHYL